MSQYETIDEFLSRGRVAIDNAQSNTQIQESLAAFGYTTEKMQEGKGIYDRAVAAVAERQAEYGDQIAATAAFKEAWSNAKTTYNQMLQVARIVFKNDPGAIAKLAIAGTRKRSLSGWMEQANLFYNNVLDNADISSRLANFGIAEEKLTAGKAEVDALERLNSAQEKEKGEAQDATKLRDRAIDELDDWLEDFLGIAEVALSDRPQLLEALGVLVRS